MVQRITKLQVQNAAKNHANKKQHTASTQTPNGGYTQTKHSNYA